jgi:hypothetical protein
LGDIFLMVHFSVSRWYVFQLVFTPTTYQIRYFLPDGKGKLEMDNSAVFLPNDLYPPEKETFRLYYTSASTDQQTIDIYIINSFGQMQQVSFSFNNDGSDEEQE